MHTTAAGQPPLSPETIGRAPSNFDTPVPLVAFDELVRARPRRRPSPLSLRCATATRLRVVVRLAGADELEVGAYPDRDEAVARAKELVALLSTAEEAGEWPEVGGRHLRPASIVSVDVVAG